LLELIKENNLAEVQAMLKRLPPLTVLSAHDDQGYTLLMRACTNRNSLPLVKALLLALPASHRLIYINQPQAPTTKQNDQFTALHFAVFFGQTEIVKFLVEAGADPKVKSTQGLGLMHVAAQSD
jgi:ankyrin repeat protein